MLMLIGLAFVVGGLSGSLVLRGSNSSLALVVLGLVMIAVQASIVFLRLVTGTTGPTRSTALEQLVADRERDAEQYAEYLRARDALVEKNLALQRHRELERLFASAPSARAEVEALLARVGAGLSTEQRHALAVDVAQRTQP